MAAIAQSWTIQQQVTRKRFSGFYLYLPIVVVVLAILNYITHPIGNDVGDRRDYSSLDSGQRHLMAFEDGNCTDAAIEQFPHFIMDETQRQNGGIVIHILVSLYMFISLAVVCDNYFVPALGGVSNALALQPDVAGATFMAAGSSAPELATSVLAVFVTKDDIGIGAVVGSAVFNIMLVIGVCALTASSALHLNWWPLTRDCIFYLLSIFLMFIAIFDGQVTWYESVMFLVLYVGYCSFMCINSRAEIWLKKKVSKSNLDLEKSLLLMSHDDIKDNRNSKLPSENETEEYEYILTRRPRGCFANFMWFLILPLLFLFYFTIPDVRQSRWQKWYAVSFLMSVVWISLFSYVLVWMVTIIGFTFGIPDTVMGLTLLAAGVSVPDLLTSVTVVKKGQGDMAVSNAIGSNVFDILLCLGLPWFIQTCIISPGSVIPVTSKGLTYSTLSLLSTIVFLLAAVHLSSWKLKKVLGGGLIIWYVAFLVFASMYELNFFGFYNLPTCPSDY